jgi:hypothetical protein
VVECIFDKNDIQVRVLEELRKLVEWFKTIILRIIMKNIHQGFESLTFWFNKRYALFIKINESGPGWLGASVGMGKS